MYANRDLQLSGAVYRQQPDKATPPQGVYERTVIVTGNTYRYRRYLKSIGLRWSKPDQAWTGKLSNSRIQFIQNKLGLEINIAGGKISKSLGELVQKTCKSNVRIMNAQKQKHKSEGCSTSWESYSAIPVIKNRVLLVQPELNINLRRCYWGCEMCGNCMECVSNIDENSEVRPEIYA